MGVLPSRAVRDRHDRRSAHPAAEARDPQGAALTFGYHGGDLRAQLASAGRAAVAAGLVVGSGGNLSARAPGADECWVTATGTWLDQLHPSSFVRVRISDGAALPGAAPGAAVPSPTSELALHLATYRVRPDVTAVVHLHPQSLLLLDALDEPVRLVTTDHVAYVRRVVRTPFALPGSAEVAELAAAAAADGADCIVLAHHGCSVLADSVELAHKRALYLEEAARLTHGALAVGRLQELRPCPPEFLAALEAGRTAV